MTSNVSKSGNVRSLQIFSTIGLKVDIIRKVDSSIYSSSKEICYPKFWYLSKVNLNTRLQLTQRMTPKVKMTFLNTVRIFVTMRSASVKPKSRFSYIMEFASMYHRINQTKR